MIPILAKLLRQLPVATTGNLSNYLKPLLAVTLTALACTCVNAQAIEGDELKMALDFNFASYVEWPHLGKSEPIDFCIFDDKDLTQTFQKLASRTIDKHSISVKYVDLEDTLSSCEVLIFNGRDRKRIALALEAVKDKPVLTIGELPDFIDSGGVINLYQEDGKYHFQINPYAAQRSKLQISARLLQLAKIAGD